MWLLWARRRRRRRRRREIEQSYLIGGRPPPAAAHGAAASFDFFVGYLRVMLPLPCIIIACTDLIILIVLSIDQIDER